MARGRLIFPFKLDIAQLDTNATAVITDGGYDEDFREPIMVPPVSGSGRGTISRSENIVTCRAQIEPGTFEELEMMVNGRSPSSQITVIMHYRDLEDAGLVEATTGRPMIRVNDRLDAIKHDLTEELIEQIPNPPGLFVTQVQSRGFGLSSLQRNLLLVTFETRDLGVRGAG